MKIRIKFSKTGSLKYIGHLDVMRYFQKLMRRGDIPICYSEGFSPHQIMSFAMPLGIGDESIAEYVDIEIFEKIATKEAIDKINAVSVPEIQIVDFREIPDGKKYNAMSSITAASYEVKLRDDVDIDFDILTAFLEMMKQDEITVTKQSKKSESTLDIKPYIYEYSVNGDTINMLLSCGSVMNIKPELVIKAVFDNKNTEFDEYYITQLRTEMYTGEYGEKNFRSLNAVGRVIY